jgi:adenylate cyclase
MGRDESSTVARLLEHLNQRLAPAATRRGGRVIRLMGDGSLIEFASAVDALAAAINFQQIMIEANRDQPDDTAIVFRIGLHLGDVLVEGDDIYGDAVNVAARLEAEAPPGGILVSRAVREAVTGRLKVSLHALGELALKNIERPIRAFRAEWSAEDWPAPSIALQAEASPKELAPALALPDKPSIAVLPFQNMSGDPEQEYFADGMVEDIITALSRIKSLFVIARHSSFSYKGKSPDIRQVGHELGVRYVLEGSVRRAGNRVRITGQLVEAETGAHLWADKFDSQLEDVFDLQDQVTIAVASAIEPSVTQAEIRRAGRKPTENLQAYDWLLRAIGTQQLRSQEHVEQAMSMARRAIELDPNLALAYAYLASWIQRQIRYGWKQDEVAETAEGVRFAHKAVLLEPADPLVLTESAFALAHLNYDVATAIPWLNRAIALNPNSAHAYGRGAVIRNFAGDYETAAEHAVRALRLSPFDTLTYAFTKARGDSHLFRRQFPDAVEWLRRAAQENPIHSPTFLHLSSALARLGRMDEARAALAHVMGQRPTSSVTWLRQRRRYPEEDFEYMLAGARLAGLPE